MTTLEDIHKTLRADLARGDIPFREYVRICKSYGIKPLMPNGDPIPENVDGRCVNMKRGAPSILPDSVHTE
jgi:hypothetical protein